MPQEHYQCANDLDPDQDRQNVFPDLGPNCLQRLLADDKSRRQQEKSQLILISVLKKINKCIYKKNILICV